MFTIGIDVGGTHIRAAAVNPNGRIISACRAPTPRDGDELYNWIALAVRRIQVESECGSASVVGLALPGIVDAERGLLLRSVNLPYLQDRLIGEELADRTGLAVKLMTDADAATWGEYSACTPRLRMFVHLRFGTGIACGIVVDDRLQPTDPNRTTHWKVLVVDDRPDAAVCPCGLRGCLETIASGPAIEQQAESLGCYGGLAGLQKAWERNEPSARTIVDEVTHAIAAAIWNLKSQISGGFVVCLGGGVVQALPCIVELTANRLRTLRTSVPGSAATVDLISAKLEDNAGVIGAGLLARA